MVCRAVLVAAEVINDRRQEASVLEGREERMRKIQLDREREVRFKVDCLIELANRRAAAAPDSTYDALIVCFRERSFSAHALAFVGTCSPENSRVIPDPPSLPKTDSIRACDVRVSRKQDK